MRINKQALDKILNPFEKEFDKANVSLFIVSTKHPSRLKKLDLDPTLSREERAQKLHKWAQQHRFVAVIEVGDLVFAHAHAKFAQQLKDHPDLKIDDKKVSVKTLTEEESHQLSTVGELFEEYVLQTSEEDKKDQESHYQQTATTRSTIKQYFTKNALITDQMKMDYVIARMQNIPNQVVLKYLKRISEVRREEQKLKEADDRKQDIKTREIKKEIRRSEIVKEEVKNYNLKKI